MQVPASIRVHSGDDWAQFLLGNFCCCFLLECTQLAPGSRGEGSSALLCGRVRSGKALVPPSLCSMRACHEHGVSEAFLLLGRQRSSCLSCLE